MGRARRLPVVWAVGVVLALTVEAFGQGIQRASIAGTVKDDTGASLPGVTVTVSGPALQVPQVVRVSDERGAYQVVELPVGTYRVTYELPGFATLVREGIILTTGFAARVDIDLKVATVAETVTVSGASPVVDVTTTRGGATLSKELLATIPGNQSFRDVMLMVGGQQANNTPQIGKLAISAMTLNGVSYGSGAGVLMTEGVKMRNIESVNFSAFEEVDVKTFGNTADVDVSGTAVQLVMKSGGNQFHGRYTEIAQGERFQSNNIDDELRAQGVTTGDSVVWYNDFTGDLGGRIIRDKLWFYTSARDVRSKFTSTGFSSAPGPDGVYQTVDDVPAFPKDRYEGAAIKLSYQATPRNKFIGLWQDNNNHFNSGYDRATPDESAYTLGQLNHDVKPIEWESTLSNRWLMDLMWGFNRVRAYRDWHGDWVAGSGVPARVDRTTLQNTGPNFAATTIQSTEQLRQQLTGRISFLPGGSFLGSHSLQTGYRLWFGRQDSNNPGGSGDGCKPGSEICTKNAGIGEYQLIFDTVGGVPHQPVELIAKTLPVSGTTHQNVYATYVTDSWRPTTRLTLNLGLRWERQIHWVEPTVKVQAFLAPFGTAVPIGTAGSFPKVDAGDWSQFAPRTGAAYNLSGDGKTVLKGTYGWFNDDLELDTYAQNFLQNTVVLYDYRWHDLNSDGNFQPGEVNLNTNGPDFVSVAGASNNKVNPNLRLPHTHEVTASVERALGPGMSIRGLFVYKRVIDALSAVNANGSITQTPVNVLRPPSVWNQAFNRQDPGPDGVFSTADDGPFYTIYDYDPAYRGAAFVSNMNMNADPNRHDSFKSIEVMLTKRPTGSWYANTSFLATRAHIWRVNVVQSPNDNIFPVGDYWDLMYLLAVGYNLPYGINVSALNQMYNGLARQRTNVFRAVDPAGGPRFPSSTTITLPMAPLAEVRGPFRNVANLRGAKNFDLGGGRRITASIDAFNVFNTNVAWGRPGVRSPSTIGINDASGPTYGNIFGIVQPRMLRFNVGFEF